MLLLPPSGNSLARLQVDDLSTDSATLCGSPFPDDKDAAWALYNSTRRDHERLRNESGRVAAWLRGRLRSILGDSENQHHEYEAVSGTATDHAMATIDPSYKRRPTVTSRTYVITGVLLALAMLAVAFGMSGVAQRALSDSTEAYSRVAYGDSSFTTNVLPAPYNGYRFSILHANVMTQKTRFTGKQTPFLEILAFIEGEAYRANDCLCAVTQRTYRVIGTEAPTPYIRPESDEASTEEKKWQVFPSRPQSIFSGQVCRFGEVVTPLRVVERKAGPQTNLFRCNLPPNLPAADLEAISLEFYLRDGQKVEHEVRLLPTIVPEPRPTLGICVSPLFGDIDMLQLVEWRLHHARVGFQTVHWYEREAGAFNLSDWIQVWNGRLGTHDTLGVAPPLSPTTWQTHAYYQNGTYADQVRLASHTAILGSKLTPGVVLFSGLPFRNHRSLYTM